MQPATNNSTLCNRRTTHDADYGKAQPWVASRCVSQSDRLFGSAGRTGADWPSRSIAKGRGRVVSLTCCGPQPVAHAASYNGACCTVHGHSARSCNTVRPAATQYMCSAVRRDGMLQVHDMAWWFPHTRSDGAPPSHSLP
jgi:hypothetical protein